MATTQTLTLTEFLTARLDEDEAAAPVQREVRVGPGHQLTEVMPRVLREVEAKRAIVAALQMTDVEHITGLVSLPTEPAAAIKTLVYPGAREALLALAAVYADHPDYRPEWRP